MGTAVFSSNVTYEPGGGGTISQAFNVAVKYTAISAGKMDVAPLAASGKLVSIPFGGVNQQVRGVVVQNNTDADVSVELNPGAGPAHARLAPGGFVALWSPRNATGTGLAAIEVVTTTAATKGGAIDYIVLGD